jgi:hypothetical protein
VFLFPATLLLSLFLLVNSARKKTGFNPHEPASPEIWGEVFCNIWYISSHFLNSRDHCPLREEKCKIYVGQIHMGWLFVLKRFLLKLPAQ